MQSFRRVLHFGAAVRRRPAISTGVFCRCPDGPSPRGMCRAFSYRAREDDLSSGDERLSLPEPRVTRKRTGKTRVSWVCESCGESFSLWWGTCQSCKLVGTLRQFLESEGASVGERRRGLKVAEGVTRSWFRQGSGEARLLSLVDVNKWVNSAEWLYLYFLGWRL